MKTKLPLLFFSLLLFAAALFAISPGAGLAMLQSVRGIAEANGTRVIVLSMLKP